jgi:hypothetical protein
MTPRQQLALDVLVAVLAVLLAVGVLAFAGWLGWKEARLYTPPVPTPGAVAVGTPCSPLSA